MSIGLRDRVDGFSSGSLGISTDDAKVRRIFTRRRSQRQYQQHVGYYTNSKTGVVGMTPSFAKVIRHATGIRVRRSQILVRFA
jgi:hypothetical protein